MPNIFTWNTQGDFTDSRKFGTILDLFDRHGCDAGLIQEGGVDKHGDYGALVAFGGTSAGAFNERCTNYVVVRDGPLLERSVPVQLNTIGGGRAGRSAAAVEMPWSNREKMLLVSWHSAASSDNTDTADLIREIDRHSTSNAIIGGDFNTASYRVEAMTAQRRRARKHAVIVASEGGRRVGRNHMTAFTHRSGRDLDFFAIIGNAAVESIFDADCLNVRASDHNPVILTIS